MKKKVDRSIKDKESKRWLTSLVSTELAIPTDTTVVTITDREGDIYQLFAYEREANSELLIRAKHNRCVEHELKYLQVAIANVPPSGTVKVLVPKQDYNNLDQCEGLGEIGANQTGAKSRGLHLHSTLAVAPNGLPLGVLRAQCTAPKEKSSEDDRHPFSIPIEEKKTFTWIEHHRDLVALSSEMPRTRLIDVCDREADFFEFFDEQRRHPCVDLLVRAKHNRNITVEPFKLFTAVRQAPVLSRVRVLIPRQSARPKKSKQKARPKRPGRTADMAVRRLRIQLPPAHDHADKGPIDICVVHALEENPPGNTKAVEWFLLTTIDIDSAEDAEQCLRWYCLRWRIEDWHRVLKSGCRIEDLAHKNAERLRRAIAINLVIAWRIMLMTLLGRETPELPAEVLFSDIELRTLNAYAKKNS